MPSPVPGYETLWNVLQDAFEQASSGKGKERHANGLPFDQQPIMSIGRRTGPGGTVFQVQKKSGESLGMVDRGEYVAAERELLGAINYAVATIMLIREMAQAEKLRHAELEKANVPVAVHTFPATAQPGPIPEGMYWDDGFKYFHDAESSYSEGTVFYKKWINRYQEFPRIGDLPDVSMTIIPRNTYWDGERDLFIREGKTHAEGSVFYRQWRPHIAKFPHLSD